MILITNLFHLTAGRYCASSSDVYQRTSCFRSFEVYPLTGEQRLICLLRGKQWKRKLLWKERKLSAVKLVSAGEIKLGTVNISL